MVTTRNLRSQRRTELRQKSTGVGLGKIEIEQNDSKKIKFDDDFVATYESSAEEEKDVSIDEDGSDDDEIEQIDNNTAKAYVMEQLANESKVRSDESAIMNKRKRKIKIVKPVDSDDDLDENFFNMVDSDRKDTAKAKRHQKIASKEGFIGKHTTFVSEWDDPDALGSITAPIQAGHNIDVVVLPGFDMEGDSKSNFAAQSASLSTHPSSTAMSLCRGRIENFETEEKGFEIKRSRKMKYNITAGKAASTFRVRC